MNTIIKYKTRYVPPPNIKFKNFITSNDKVFLKMVD